MKSLLVLPEELDAFNVEINEVAEWLNAASTTASAKINELEQVERVLG